MLLTTDPYADARSFLTRVLPWPPLGIDAWVNIHWTHQKPGYNNPAFRGTPCKDVQQCVNAIAKNVGKPGNLDFYVCLSTQRETSTMQTANGGFQVAQRSLEHAVQIRSLWLDLDVEAGNKSGKCYQTPQAAAQALAAFLANSSMPEPNVIVASGSGGFHVYWTLNAALSYEHWRPLAFALAEATRRHGLLNDTGCTVDGARVLRIPGTLNKKHNPPRPVKLMRQLPHDYDVEMIRTILSPYMGAQVIPLHTSKGNLNDELSGGIDQRKAPPINIDTVAQGGCGFIEHALAAGGKDYNQPLWNLTTLVATFTEGGRTDAHRMARGHAGYISQDTDALYDRKENERATRDLGWPSCDAVENAGCKSCAGCPIRTPGSKPLQFGQPSVQAVPALVAQAQKGDLPPGYTRNGAGIVQKIVIQKDGSARHEPVCDYPMDQPWVQEFPWTLHFVTKIGGIDRSISALLTEVNGQKFGGMMAEQGIALAGKQIAEMKDFLMSWTRKLQETKGALVTAAPFGWIYNKANQLEGFAYNGTVFMANGETRPAAVPGPVLVAQYTPRGDLADWVKAAEMVTSLGSPERDAYIAAAFAAPLVHFTGQEGLMISTFSSDSGRFKSTSLKVGQSVWGDPIQGTQGLSDTLNGVIGKVGTLKNLPMFWDELKTDQDTQKFVQLAFQISGGKEKQRMGADTQLRVVQTWETLLVSASNDSILDHIARATKTTTAGIHRVFEFTVPPTQSKLTSSEADQIMLRLRRSFGQAGLVYSKFLGENYARVAQDVAKLKQALENKHTASKEERFWISTMAVLICGAMYANQLNLTKIDVKRLVGFLATSLGNMRNEVRGSTTDMKDDSNVASILQQFIGSMSNRIIITDKMWTKPARPPKNYAKLVGQVDMSRINGLAVHVAVEDKIMRVSVHAFNEWCEGKKYSPHNVTNALKEQFAARRMNGKLGSGLGSVLGLSEWLLEFNLSNPALAHYLNMD